MSGEGAKNSYQRTNISAGRLYRVFARRAVGALESIQIPVFQLNPRGAFPRPAGGGKRKNIRFFAFKLSEAGGSQDALSGSSLSVGYACCLWKILGISISATTRE